MTSYYQKVKEAIEYISSHKAEQPSVEQIAKACSVTVVELHSLFKNWCGLTPMSFLQALTLDHARDLLRHEATILDAAFETGLSSAGRLHDLFVTHEAMSPGEYKNGLDMAYGFHESPFGEALIVTTSRGMAGLGFVDEGNRAEALSDMQRRWPKARLVLNEIQTKSYVERIFNSSLWQPHNPLKVTLIGTDFQVRVWESLLKIPVGQMSSYGAIASHLNNPKAVRAVGGAVGRNPISFVVPCHRVLGKSGALTGYHWGLTRKQAMIGWEKGKVGG
jgi:AraC family transcriptional regulator, regulatory protein of adaptative response / methylated-DNA-[protein]-cysteine methyltransferase